MNRINLAVFSAAAMLLCASCSHNPAVFTIGKQVKVGTTEYGELSYLNGFAIVDVSRENSEWEIEVDDQDGISFDAETKTLKGVRKIRRKIGKQVSGYLVELAEKCPELAKAYLLENATDSTSESAGCFAEDSTGTAEER